MESIVTMAQFVGLCWKYFPFFFSWAFQLSPFDPSRHFGKMQNSVGHDPDLLLARPSRE
jgi:hypothetical protein